jgi:hypothetical protein
LGTRSATVRLRAARAVAISRQASSCLARRMGSGRPRGRSCARERERRREGADAEVRCEHLEGLRAWCPRSGLDAGDMGVDRTFATTNGNPRRNADAGALHSGGAERSGRGWKRGEYRALLIDPIRPLPLHSTGPPHIGEESLTLGRSGVSVDEGGGDGWSIGDLRRERPPALRVERLLAGSEAAAETSIDPNY